MSDHGTSLQPLALRLGPGQELKSGLLDFVRERNVHSACVLTCVGSLRKATIRLANFSAGMDHGNEVVRIHFDDILHVMCPNSIQLNLSCAIYIVVTWDLSIVRCLFFA